MLHVLFHIDQDGEEEEEVVWGSLQTEKRPRPRAAEAEAGGGGTRAG